MRKAVLHWIILGICLGVCTARGVALADPVEDAISAQRQALTRSEYEQIRPALERIRVGEPRSKVLEVVRPKAVVGRYFSRRQGNPRHLEFHNWPGVLTPFNNVGYLQDRISMEVMHFGYLNGQMLRPLKILIFADDTVTRIIDLPDIDAMLNQSDITLKEVHGPLIGNRSSYEDTFLRFKDRIKPGMHLWEVYTLLGANYMTSAELQGFLILCPGLLNESPHRTQRETTDGILSHYPFGYREGGREVVEWELELLNRKVIALRPYVQPPEPKVQDTDQFR